MRQPRAVLLALRLPSCRCRSRQARADQQRDPELKALLQKIIGSTDCFADKFDSEVWYKSMEPRLAQFVPTHEARVEILDHVYCEAKRDPTLQLPPDLVLALIEVESRFDRWAVSPAGAVGLMQVMPFWPRQLGVQNQLVQVAPNIRMGCEILRYYLRVENHNWTRRWPATTAAWAATPIRRWSCSAGSAPGAFSVTSKSRGYPAFSIRCVGLADGIDARLGRTPLQPRAHGIQRADGCPAPALRRSRRANCARCRACPRRLASSRAL